MIYMCTKAEKVVLHGFAVGSAFEPQKSSSGTFLHFIFDRLLRSFGVNLENWFWGVSSKRLVPTSGAMSTSMVA